VRTQLSSAAKRPVLLLASLVLAGACGAAPASTAAPSATNAASIAVPSAAPVPTPAPTVVASPTPTRRPAILPGEEWLAFQGDDGGGTYGVRLVRPDGTDTFFPTDTAQGTWQLHPDWSPDGLRLVFSTQGPVNRDLWATDADGAHPDHIVVCDTCTQADEPAWSPDGKSIAFHRQALVGDTWVSTLELYDIATRATRVVLTAAPDRVIYAPRWSPDSSKVVMEYVHRRDGTIGFDDLDSGELVIVDVTAAKPKAVPITAGSYWPANPDWSPDGTRIVFFAPLDPAKFNDESDLWTIKPDGTDLKQITHFADQHAIAIHPDYTPDGTRIAFVTGQAGADTSVMVTVAADGSDLQPATSNGYRPGLHPRFRPTP
jgi:Tol biopolymer transport system component